MASNASGGGPAGDDRPITPPTGIAALGASLSGSRAKVHPSPPDGAGAAAGGAAGAGSQSRTPASLLARLPKRPAAPPPPEVLSEHAAAVAATASASASKRSTSKSSRRIGAIPVPPMDEPPLEQADIDSAKQALDAWQKREEETLAREAAEAEARAAAERRAAKAREAAAAAEAERKRRLEEAERRQREREEKMRKDGKVKPKVLPPPPPPREPLKWVPLNGNIFPRGRLELEVTRVSHVGPGTGGLEKTGGANRTQTTALTGFAAMTRGFSRTSAREDSRGNTARSNSSDGKSSDLVIGAVFLRFELNLGTARFPARTDLYRNVIIADFETPQCNVEFLVAEGIAAPQYPDKLRLDQKAALPPILFYSVWRQGRLGEELIAEGQLPAGALFLPSVDGKKQEISLPLRGSRQDTPMPRNAEQMTSWITAQFRFVPSVAGVLAITVHEGRELFNAAALGKQSPYPVLTLGAGNRVRGTVCKEGGINPMFNHEELVIWVDHAHVCSRTPVELSLAVDGLGGGAHIGTAKLDIQDLVSDYEIHNDALDLLRDEKYPAGSLLLTRQFYPAGQLTVRVVEGRNLAAADALGGNDAYVKVDLEGRVRSYSVKTAVHPNSGSNPVFNETFIFDIVDHCELNVALWDFDQFTADDLVGEVMVDLEGVFRFGLRDAAVPIKRRGGWGALEDRGQLVIEADFLGPPRVAFPQLRPDKQVFDDKERRNRYGKTAAELERERQRQQEAVKKAAAEEAEMLADVDSFEDDEIEAAFEFLDLDKNLYIGRAELRHVLTCMGELITDLEIDEMIDMVDHDGDGQVAFYEFYQVAKAVDPGLHLWKPRPEENFKDRDWFAEGGIKGLDDRDRGADEAATSSGHTLQFIDAKAEAAAKRAAVARALEMARKNEKKVACEKTISKLALRLPELQRSFRRFQRMECYDSGMATFEEMCDVLDVEQDRDSFMPLFTAFRDDQTTCVNIREMLLALNNFTGCTKPQRINFCFFLFDVDDSGSISTSELTGILKASHLAATEASVRSKAEMILRQADKDGSGQIDLEEFVVIANRFPNVLFPNYGAAVSLADTDPRAANLGLAAQKQVFRLQAVQKQVQERMQKKREARRAAMRARQTTADGSGGEELALVATSGGGGGGGAAGGAATGTSASLTGSRPGSAARSRPASAGSSKGGSRPGSASRRDRRDTPPRGGLLGSAMASLSSLTGGSSASPRASSRGRGK